MEFLSTPLEIVQEGEHGEITLIQENVDVIQASHPGSVSIEILSIIADFSEDVLANAKRIVEHLHNFIRKAEVPSTIGGDVVESSKEDPQISKTDPVLNILYNYADKILQMESEVNHSDPVKKKAIQNFIQAAAAVKEVAKYDEKDVTSDGERRFEFYSSDQQNPQTAGVQVPSIKRILCWPEVLLTQKNNGKHLLILLVDEQSILGSGKMSAFVRAVSSFQVHFKFLEMLDDKIQNVITTNEYLRNIRGLLNEAYLDAPTTDETPSSSKLSPKYASRENGPIQKFASSYPKRIPLETLASFFSQSILDINLHCQDKTSKALEVKKAESPAETPFKKTIVKIHRNNSAISSKLPKPVPPPDKPKRLLERSKKEQQDILERNWVGLMADLENWIATNLQIENIEEIEKRFVPKIVNIKAPESVKRSLKERMLEIKQVVMHYFVEDTNETSTKAVELETISETEISQRISHPECSSLIFKAIEKLRSMSATSTDSQLCDSILTTCASNISKFYVENFLHHPELQNLRSISAIIKLHSELVSELIAAFDQVLCRLGFHKDKLVRINQLRQTIDNDFYLAIGQLNNKWQVQIKQIQGLINNQRAEYEAAMELLFKNTNKVEASRLSQEHDKLVEVCTKNFQKIMTDTFDNDEPLDCHISALHFYFDKAFKSYGGEIKPTILKTKTREASRKPAYAEPLLLESPKTVEGKSRILNELVDVKGSNVSSEDLMPVTSQSEKFEPSDVVLLEFSLSRIGISSLNQDEDFAPENVQHFSDSIALTKKEEWMLCDENESPRGIPIQTFWKLRDCWGSCEKFVLSHAVKINGCDEYVGIEFLIAVWVKLVFRKYFGNAKPINEALVAVPIWFTSLQRQQVVHAMEILKISHSTLVNENSASAYFLYRQLNFPNYNIAVISENSGKVDMALFFYNPESRKVEMIAHHSNYEPFPVENGNVINFVKYKIFQGSSGENSANDLQMLWKHVLDKTELTHQGQRINVAKAIVRTESSTNVELLVKFAKEISADNGILDNNSTLAGLAEISRTDSFIQEETTENLIKDMSAFNVLCRTSVDQEPFPLFTKLSANSNHKECLNLRNKTKTESITLTICQQHSGLTADLGSLTIKSKSKSYFEIQVSIQSWVDGRINLLPINYNIPTKSIPRFLGMESKILKASWEVTTPKQVTIHKYKLLFDKLTFLDRQLHNAIKISEGAIQKSKFAMQKLQDDQGGLKSNDGRNQVLRLLENAIVEIQNNHDINEIKSQSNLIDQICDKYKL